MNFLDIAKRNWKYVGFTLAILGFIFTLKAIDNIKDDYSVFSGDPAEIVKLYYEQSNDRYVLENKEMEIEFMPLITMSTLKFPNGTPIQNAVSKTLISGMNKTVNLAIDSQLPNAVGVPKSLKGEIGDYFKPKLKIIHKNKETNKFKVTKGETITLEVYLDKKLVSVKDEAFISASYDPDIIKLIGNNTFKAISNGETELGVLYFDGEKNHIKKIKVLVSL